MRETPIWRRYLRLMGSNPGADVEDELAFHLASREQDLMRKGLSEAEARNQARREFGDVERVRVELHQIGRRRLQRQRRAREWDSLGQNLRYAFRTLFKTPFVAAVAILSLALGIGANAAIYSLFEQLLLRPLPVRQPEQLVNLAAPGQKPGWTACTLAGDCDAAFTYPMFRDLERAQTVFTGIAAHRLFDTNLSVGGRTSSAEGMLVSGSYFSVLGLKPALGRLLGPADDQTPGGHFVAVLSHSFWEARLGADPAVLNQRIVVNGHPMTIVGVAPKGFEGTTLGARPQVFVPVSMLPLMSLNFDQLDDPGGYWLYLFARLKTGISMDGARTAINSIYQPIVSGMAAPAGASAELMGQFRGSEITLEPGLRGQSRFHDNVRTPLVLLFAITGIVLLIACANIANLLLARGANRSMEMAVRLSLGASRRNLIAQLLTESLVLAVLGGAAGLFIASGTLSLVAAFLPADTANLLELRLRWPVVLFAAGLSVGTGLLFGMFPALQSTRPELVSTIRANAGQIAGARSPARLRRGLVTAQIALSMMLLISAGLFLKSMRNIARIDLGLRMDHVLTFAISPELNGYSPEQSKMIFERVEEELAAIPGVSDVSASRVAVLSGENWGSAVSVEGFTGSEHTDASARVNLVGSGYFRTLGIPLLSGREFTRGDRAGAPKVAIVNEAFARRFNLGRYAVGKRMSAWGNTELDTEIVGVVADAAYSEMKEEVPPLFFTPYRQDERIGTITFYARTTGDPAHLLRKIPGVVANLDPNLPVEDVKTMPQQARESVFLDRMISTLSGAFAVLATLLAAVGLYGVLAYSVAQRTREIGVRLALGAEGRHVRDMVLRQVGGMVLVGGVIGAGAAVGLGRWVGSLLFGLDGNDPAVMIAAVATLALVALGAGYLPAYRASRVDPMEALRYE